MSSAMQTSHAVLTKTLYCRRSGVPLLSVQTLCSNGWPALNAEWTGELVHPVYSFQLSKLIRRLSDLLDDSDAAGWQVTDAWVREAGLTMSAILFDLDVISPHSDPCLPDQKTVFGTADRLRLLAEWYHHISSKRVAFPAIRFSKAAGNTNWHGFSGWMDAAEELWADWETKKRRAENKELLKAQTKAVREVQLSKVYKRVDLNKVWNWVAIQVGEDASKYPIGRLATFKELFMTGDLHPEEWMADDCDDLMEAVTAQCDLGNDIMHFIRHRMSHIREAISNFYGSFTLISNISTEAKTASHDMTAEEQLANERLFGSYDAQVNAEDFVLPAEPQRQNFASMALYLKAKAEWSLLKRRADARNGTQAAKVQTIKVSPASFLVGSSMPTDLPDAPF